MARALRRFPRAANFRFVPEADMRACRLSRLASAMLGTARCFFISCLHHVTDCRALIVSRKLKRSLAPLAPCGRGHRRLLINRRPRICGRVLRVVADLSASVLTDAMAMLGWDFVDRGLPGCVCWSIGAWRHRQRRSNPSPKSLSGSPAPNDLCAL